jgi:two-component system chemotaxis response regulator CheY
MIVDDSTVIRRKIERCEFINQQKIDSNNILQACNGVEAVEMFEQYRPDLITMDLTMPQMDGVECVQQIVAKDSSVKILVVSALTDKETALQAIRNGARGFLSKPFTEEQLSAALRQVSK